MDKLKLESLRNQFYMLERTVRAMRVNLEEMALQAPGESGSGQARRLVPCPLSELLGRAYRFPRRAVVPYENIFEGVTVAFPPKSDTVSMGVESRGFAVDSSLEEPGSSCLILRVNRSANAGPAWATLETELALDDITSLSSMELRLILSFQNRGWRTLGAYRVFLRLFHGDEFKDYCPRSFPALDVPIEASYRIDAEEMATLPRLGVRGARLIVGLPMSDEADYTALLSHFELSGTQAGA